MPCGSMRQDTGAVTQHTRRAKTMREKRKVRNASPQRPRQKYANSTDHCGMQSSQRARLITRTKENTRAVAVSTTGAIHTYRQQRTTAGAAEGRQRGQEGPQKKRRRGDAPDHSHPTQGQWRTNVSPPTRTAALLRRAGRRRCCRQRIPWARWARRSTDRWCKKDAQPRGDIELVRL